MKIEKINIYNLAIPFTKPKTWGWSTRLYTRTNLLELISNKGFFGYGVTRISSDVIENISPLLVGKSIFDFERLYIEIYQMGYSDLWVGLEAAIFDIIGKKFDIPVINLIGGIFRKKVKISPTIFINEIDETVQEIKSLMNDGFNTFNLKGGRNIKHDLDLVEALRDEIGYEIEISFNFNSLMSLPTAVRFLKKIENYDLAFIMTPISTNSIAGYERLRSISKTPISIHDNLWIKEDVMRYLLSKSIDFASVYPGSKTCITEIKKICSICEANGVPVLEFSGEMAISNFIALNLACSTPNIIYPIISEYHTEADDIIIGGKIKFINGAIELEEKPGFGFEIDHKKLKKYEDLYSKVKKENIFEKKEYDFITHSMK